MTETTPKIQPGDTVTFGEGRVGKITRLDTSKKKPGRHWRISTLWGEHITLPEAEIVRMPFDAFRRRRS